jgi:hypothetical protein
MNLTRKADPMHRSFFSVLLAASAVLLAAGQAAAQQICTPALSISDARLSDIRHQHRTWTAVVSVDASRCTATSGRFEIAFDRAKETAPDMRFVERFTWASSKVDVSVEFWADEAVQDYVINYVEPCICRN